MRCRAAPLQEKQPDAQYAEHEPDDNCFVVVCGEAVTDAVLGAVRGVDGTLACSVHQSHAYTTGACCYFTFGGQPPPNERERYYHTVYDAGMGAALACGAALSHHHGVGLNRARFLPDALGTAFDVLVALKGALDPHCVLNPGKLGLPDPFE